MKILPRKLRVRSLLTASSLVLLGLFLSPGGHAQTFPGLGIALHYFKIIVQGETPAELALSSGKCELNTLCTNSGTERLWAQSRVDADLAKKEVDRILSENRDVRVKVAVVDSGFDYYNHSSSIAGSVRVGKAHDKGATDDTQIGSPYIDENGHGTMVAGVIAGKDGLGITHKADIAVYRGTRKGSTGSTSGSWLEQGIRRACEENADPAAITIINLSWGGAFDESGQEPDEKRDQMLIKTLGEKGCLVTKSAGNSSFRNNDRSYYHLDDAYLRVSATDHSNSLSWFSSNGEIAAPGFGVYTLESVSSLERTSDSMRRCEGDPEKERRRFVNGTSFSAPMVAGIAAQVVAVLKSRGVFAPLQNPERIKLVNRILKASMFPVSMGQISGSTNALRAVKIAENVSLAQDLSIPSVDQLIGALNRNPGSICQSPAPSCLGNSACGEIQSCADELRKYRALCNGEQLPQANEDLLKLGLRSKNLESAVHQINLIQSTGFTEGGGSSSLQQIRRHLYNLYLSRWANLSYGTRSERISRSLDINIARELVHPILRDIDLSSEASKNWISEQLSILLASRSLEEYLARGPERGSESYLEFTTQLLTTYRARLGDEALAKSIQAMVGDYITHRYPVFGNPENKSHTNTLGVALIAPFRIIGELISKPEFSSLQSPLKNEETRLYQTLRGRNDLYGEEVDVIGAIFDMELQATLAYLRPVIGRHKEDILSSIRSGNVQSLAPAEFIVAIQDQGFFESPADLLSALEGGTDLILNRAAWGPYIDSELVKKILDSLSRLYAANPELQNRVGALVDRIIHGVSDHYVADTLLKNFDQTLRNRSRTSPPNFVTKERVNELVSRFLHTLNSMSGEERFMNYSRAIDVFSLDRLMLAARQGLSEASEALPQSLRKIEYNLSEDQLNLDRFNNPTGSLAKFEEIPREPIKTAYARWVNWMIDSFRQGVGYSPDIFRFRKGEIERHEIKMDFDQVRLNLGFLVSTGGILRQIKAVVSPEQFSQISRDLRALSAELIVAQEESARKWENTHTPGRRNYLAKVFIGDEKASFIDWARAQNIQPARTYDSKDIEIVDRVVQATAAKIIASY